MLEEKLASDGFVSLRQVLTEAECEELVSLVAAEATNSAGTRCLLSRAWCRSLVECLRRKPSVEAVVPASYVAVQCTYFEKSASRNWLVPVHQDLSIPVATRVRSSELRGWSEKEGNLFAQPPVPVLESLLALRVHLDRCSQLDGPLQVLPGTHRQGRIEPERARELRRRGPVVDCLAERGDALAMRPLLLHASSKASGTSLRRVLHFLFGPAHLPHGLRWPNVV